MINTLIMNAKNVTQLLIEAVKLLFIIDIAFVIIWIMNCAFSFFTFAL